jgi:hypothetical protein
LFVLQQVCLAHWSTQYQRWRLHQWHSSLVVQVRWHFKLRFLRTGQHRVLYTVLITGRRGHDCMEVEFTTTCTIVPKATKVVNSNPAHGEVYSIQHYVINFVSDLSERNHRSPKARREKIRDPGSRYKWVGKSLAPLVLSTILKDFFTSFIVESDILRNHWLRNYFVKLVDRGECKIVVTRLMMFGRRIVEFLHKWTRLIFSLLAFGERWFLSLRSLTKFIT